ncbi:MAG: SH3 domain-containing protein [Caldilineaceae bacterium]
MKKRTIYFIAIPLVAVALIIGGGWWANRAGLLGQWLAPTAQTASSVSAGVEAQPGQPGQPGQSDQHGRRGQTGVITGTMTMTMPFGGSDANGFPPPPDGMAPPDGAPPPDGMGAPPNGFPPPAMGAPVTTTVPVSGTVSVTDSAIATATPAAAAKVAAIPAVAGVGGSRLYADDGTLLVTLDSGATVLVTGRSADDTWLSVTGSDGTDGSDGWIEATQLIVYGLHRLAVTDVPAAVQSAAGVPTDAAGMADAVSLTTTQAVTITPVLLAGDALTVSVAAPVTNPVAALPAVTPSAATTASMVATAVITPTAAAATPLATVKTDQGRLNIRSGPGTGYLVVAKANDGAIYPVVGRSTAGEWLELQLDGGETGWASAAYLEVEGDVSGLSVPSVAAPSTQANGAATPAASSPTSAAATTTAASSAASVVEVANHNTGATGDLQGTLVFQQSPGGTIYAYNLATGKLWELTHGFDPAISPDGSTVAFVRDGGETGLYLINIDGSNERRIFERSVLSSPKWSPDGKSIVFTRHDEGVDCYQMGPNYCMLPEEAKHRFPMGIPDTIPLVTEYQYKLSAVNSDGSNFHDIAALNSARAPDWSDAGIVYQSSAGIQITSDGENAENREVIFDNLNPYYFDPDLQPGGSQIVFQIKGAAQTDLWAVNTDGTGKHALTQPKTTLVDTLPSNVAAAYSPDGKYIVFLSNRQEDNNAGDWHLWVMNADGSNQRQLPIDVAVNYTYGLDQVVSWGA